MLKKIVKKTDNIGYLFILSDIGYTDYAFLETDNIGIGIGIGITYRLGSGKQSVIPIMLRPTIGITEYAPANNRYNRYAK